VATSLKLDDERFSLALHHEFGSFLSEYTTSPSLIEGKVAIMRTEIEAEKLACEWLSNFHESRIAVRYQGKPAMMCWRHWGWVPGPDGYRKIGLVLSLANRKVWSELDLWPFGPFEMYAVLNRLETVFPGAKADTCATCPSFAFSGMLRDMGSGTKGYCMHPERTQTADDRPPVMSVLDRCDFCTIVRDADREIPYLQG